MNGNTHQIPLPQDDWRLGETLRLLGCKLSYDENETHLILPLTGGEGWPQQTVGMPMKAVRRWLGPDIKTVEDLRQRLSECRVSFSGDVKWSEIAALLKR